MGEGSRLVGRGGRTKAWLPPMAAAASTPIPNRYRRAIRRGLLLIGWVLGIGCVVLILLTAAASAIEVPLDLE